MADAELEKLKGVRSSLTGKQRDLSRYLKHDLVNHIVPFAAVYEVIRDEDVLTPRGEERVSYEELLLDLGQLDATEFPLFARHIRRAPHVLAVMPALRASTDFLNDPTPQNYQRFHGTSIPFQSVLRMAGADTICGSDDLINGPRSIMILNLAENARNYGVNNHFTVGINGDTISIRNLSEHPLPENPFELGVKGPRGKSGVGLFIARAYADLEGIPLQASQETVPSSPRREIIDGWDVSFAFPVGAYTAASLPLNVVSLKIPELIPSRPS